MPPPRRGPGPGPRHTAPPAPVDPLEVDRELVRLSEVLEDVTAQHATASTKAAAAEVAYKNGFAAALIRQHHAWGKGAPANVKEAEALIEVADAYLEYVTAVALRDHLVEASRSVRAQLSALQTIAANYRAAAG